ncbi:MAG: hypothetical protein Q9203_005150, partial [Teloschistes exilis]
MPSHGKAHSQEYNPPGIFENLDEITASSPVEARKRRSQAIGLEERTADPGRSWIAWDAQDDSQEEHYDIPDDYQNLDELKAPTPVKNAGGVQHQGFLEDYRSSTTPSDGVRSQEPEHHGGSPITYHETSSPSMHDPYAEKQEPSARHQRVSRIATELYTISYLIFFSILGTLARLGLQALTFYPGAPVQTGVLWANVGGSLIMGFLAEDRKFFSAWSPPSSQDSQSQNPHGETNRPSSQASSTTHKKQHAALKKTIPLYIGLSTGFCGSFTSFSSFIRDAFLALANALPVPISHTSTAAIDPASTVHRNGGYSLMALLAVIITTVSLSLSALMLGAHLAIAVERYMPSMSHLFARRFVDRAVVLLAWGSWLGAIFMAIWPPDRHSNNNNNNRSPRERWRGTALFALIFAPPGCLARFYLSLALNSTLASFPLGTFTVNVFGCAVEAMLYDLQRIPLRGGTGGGVLGCQVLQGMMDG